ncbi:hypothetical protein DYB30_012248 [Aphanomyces astaci]|uniref:N-acetyltransferase domain-containing protein n=1 Tax=Aphanomyces astaci TaxID=112090 RepID=A0A397CM02_APHAT|nr:hypothetical protein DYB30_012248 [Aphanomyces astaci]
MGSTRLSIQAISNAKSFLDLTLPLRQLDPIGTNQIASIAIAIATGDRSPEGISFFVAFATNDDGDNPPEVIVTAFAMYSSSRGVFLSPSMSSDEATTLGEIVAHTVEPLLVELTGIGAAAVAFNDSYCRHRPQPTAAVWKEDLLLYVLGNLQPPSPSTVAGAMRVATVETDTGLLTAWTIEFFEYIGIPAQDAPHFTASGLKRQALFVWEVEGTPVGFAGYAPPVDVEGETVYRIGPVFIASMEQRKGYASGLTAALSQHLQATNQSRSSRVCLFADAANPASNKAYQNAGFEVHSQLAAYSFEPK